MSHAPASVRRTAAAPARTRAARGAGRARESLVAWAFLAPLVAIFAAFYLWPAINTIGSSLFKWGLLRPWRLTDTSTWMWVGTGNYRQVLSDSEFWNAAFNTAVWLVVFPVAVTAISLAVAILIWHVARGPAAAVFRSVFVLPMTISLTAVGVIWSFVYNPDPDFGVFNAALGVVNIPAAQWLSDLGGVDLGFAELRLTNVAVIAPAVWGFVGFGVITITAGLTAVSQDLVDAARVDGARGLQIVRHVLIPALRGPMAIVVVVSVIFALRTFDIVYVLTGGGPAQDTQVLALLLWQMAFVFLDTPQGGAAAAIAVILSVMMVVGAAPQLRGLARSARG
jgi:ABC-type sugar transport system permease subunit